MKYYLVGKGDFESENKFLVEAEFYELDQGWAIFRDADDMPVTALSPGGDFYFRELTEEEYRDTLEQLDEPESQEDEEETSEPVSFADLLQSARENARPVFKEE